MLNSLHNHFEKFIFETDPKKANESKQNLSIDLKSFSKHFKNFVTDMKNRMVPYRKCMEVS